MKKVISSLLVAAVAMFSTVAMADNITLEQAKEAAAHYLSHNTSNEKLTASDMTLVYQIDNLALNVPAAYFFNASGDGWLIMAATTVVNPIIGYSDEGKLDISNLAENMRWYVEGYVEDIKEVQILDAEENLPDAAEWTVLANKGLVGNTKDTDVKLTQVRWDQGEIYSTNSYNRYCPVYNGYRCYVGCGATAMAQMCYYYKYPRRGANQTKTYTAHNIGNRSISLNFDTVYFNYENMRLSINLQNITQAQINNIAWLSYACGVSCGMEYGIDGSSTTAENVNSGSSIYLKYRAGNIIMRGGMTTRKYVGKVRKMLKAKDLVYMRGTDPGGSGRDAGGHAWLCTGYKVQDTTMYYMNWGWGGSENGFFNLTGTDLATSSYNFRSQQGIIENMIPPEDSNIHHEHQSINRVDESTILRAAYPNPASDYVTLPFATERAGELQVFSVDGRKVTSARVSAGNGEVNVNVEKMPAGVYIYKLNNATGKFVVK